MAEIPTDFMPSAYDLQEKIVEFLFDEQIITPNRHGFLHRAVGGVRFYLLFCVYKLEKCFAAECALEVLVKALDRGVCGRVGDELAENIRGNR